jgi:hypothetical protein
VPVSLVQLVADPKCDRYHFAADVRHDTAGKLAGIGLYFGYREHRTEDNQHRGGYFTLAYSDRGALVKQREMDDGNRFGLLELEAVLFEVRPNLLYRARNSMAGERFSPDWPKSQPSPWRRLAIVVTPEKVDLYWEKTPVECVLIKTIPASGKWSLDEVFTVPTRHDKSVAGVPTRFSPRDGLGLYVMGAEASFRNIVLEPLAPNP